MLLQHPQVAAEQAEPSRPPTIQERLQDLQARAQRGDRRAMADLRTLLDHHPELWRAASDLAAPAIDAWLALAAPDNLLIREALRRRIEELRRELLGDDRRPLVVLHIEIIIAAWAQVQACHHLAAEAVKHGGKLADQMQKHLASAERQYHRALKQLLEVPRRLPNVSTKAAAASADASPKPPAAAQTPEQPSSPATPRACPPTPAQQPAASMPRDDAELPTTPQEPLVDEVQEDGLPDDAEADGWYSEATEADLVEFARKLSKAPSYEYFLAQQEPGDIALRFRPQQGPG